MKDILVKDSDLILASQEGIDAFIKVISDAILNSIGGKLTCDNMSELNADQITLIAYSVLRDEVMDGGFVQLIYNGWGPFFFNNPFAKAIRLWGLTDLAPLINKANRLYKKHRADIEKDYTDDEFMELFERFPDFDDLDDKFVENEEQWTNRIAFYVDDNLDTASKLDSSVSTPSSLSIRSSQEVYKLRNCDLSILIFNCCSSFDKLKNISVLF